MKLLDCAINWLSTLAGESRSEHPEIYAATVLVVFLSAVTLMLLI